METYPPEAGRQFRTTIGSSTVADSTQSSFKSHTEVPPRFLSSQQKIAQKFYCGGGEIWLLHSQVIFHLDDSIRKILSNLARGQAVAHSAPLSRTQGGGGEI